MLYKPNDKTALTVCELMLSQRQHWQSLCSHGALALGARCPPAACHTGRICPLAPAGNAARNLTVHRHQRRIRLVSPNQLVKHYTDDYGCSAYTGFENIKRPIAIKAIVAAREHGTIMLQGHRQYLLLTELLSGLPGEPQPRFLHGI